MKPLFVISSPFDTYSGYGARSRDLIKAIVETGKYDVKLLSQRWGNTPFGFCEDNPEWRFLINLTLNNNQLTQKPDIWAQVTVPNEFQSIGKYNIGFTAGIETTIAIPEWIEGCNRMNLNIVSSKHSADVLKNSAFQKVNEQTKQVEGELKLTKPVEVLFEGADLEKYFEMEDADLPANGLVEALDEIPEPFAYLFVGHWMQGDLGEDRKNVGLMIKAFLELFKNKPKKPALILKTSGAGSSYLDREMILTKIQQIKDSVEHINLPNIYLLHGEFSDEEMNYLYNHPKVKAMINLTKGEGFGRPLLEFSLAKKPIIVSNWSGHMDFLNPEFVVAINGELKNVHPSAANQFLVQDSQWFSPNHAEIGQHFKDVFDNYKKYTDGAKRQAYRSKTMFNFDEMKKLIGIYLDQYIPEFPKQVQIKLPTMNKISLPKRPTITNG
jgi:hypothetical protein